MDENIPVVDLRGAMDRLDGDRELWDEIKDIWLEDAPQMMQAVREAADQRSNDGLRRSAHALKGASSNVGATRVAEAARQLEHDAVDGDWAGLLQGVEILEREMGLASLELANQVS